MVAATGSNQTPKASNSTTNKLSFDATTGTIYAISKSFRIDHPSKEGMILTYGSLEGPEHGVYIRGKATTNIIELPDYWRELVDPNSITVQLTATGRYQQELYVDKIFDNKVFIGNENHVNKNISCFYLIQAERVDIPKLEVEKDA
jgi:hypothetical protein